MSIIGGYRHMRVPVTQGYRYLRKGFKGLRVQPRMVKKLESGLTTEVTTPPSPTLRLACCPSPPAYSTSSESRTGGGGEAYELEDLTGIHYGNGRSGTAA